MRVSNYILAIVAGCFVGLILNSMHFPDLYIGAGMMFAGLKALEYINKVLL